MILKYALSLALLASVTACVIHPPYQEPDIGLAEKWHSPLPHQGDVNALTQWWSQFNDPVLDLLLLAAQQDNPTLEIAVANIQIARANLQGANGQRWPSLAANGSAAQRKSGNAGGSGNIETESVSLDAQWEPDLFGGIQFSRNSADASAQAQQFNWHQARISLAAEVAASYVRYRACELAVRTLQEATNSQQETARITKVSADVGFTAPADARLALASAKTSESRLIGQQAQCALEIKSLVTLTNLPEEKLQTTLAQTTKIPQPSLFLVNQLPAALLKQRPDLLAAERRLAAASADIGVAKAQLYPSITLNGSIGYQRTVFNGNAFKTETWSFGPSINLPIFDGGQLKSQVNVAQANFNLQLQQYKDAVRNAVQEVEQALVNLDAAKRQVAIEQAAVEAYQDNFNAAQINWRAGGLDLLALEDARRQMINAQTSLITQQQNHVLYWIALYKAFGGDWQIAQAKQNEILEKKVSS